MENNTRLPGSLQLWNKECFGNIFRRKIRLWARLEGIQKQLSSNHSDRLLKLERKLHQELEMVLNQEALLWYQKYREEWIAFGDSNGQWISNPLMLENMAADYYKTLYQAEITESSKAQIPNGFPQPSEYHCWLLRQNFVKGDFQGC